MMLFSNPVFGVGYDNFTDNNYLTAHNSIVLPMAELGLPGLAIWVGIIWYCVRMMLWVGYGSHAKLEKFNGTAIDTPIAREVNAGQALVMAWLGFGISAFFLSQTYKAPLFLLCGLSVARFAAASRVLPDPPQYRLLPDLPKLGLVTLACVAFVYLVVRVSL